MRYATGIGLGCLLVGGIAGLCAGLALKRRAYGEGYDQGYVDGAEEERRRSRFTPEERLLTSVFRTEQRRHAREAVTRHDLLPQAQADATTRELWQPEWGKWS